MSVYNSVNVIFNKYINIYRANIKKKVRVYLNFCNLKI